MKVTNFDTISPAIRPIPPSNKWYRLVDPISYDVGEAMSGDRISVPVGFETDMASIPRPLWAILPPFGRYMPAAIIHDYLYMTQERSRKQSDKIFKEAMKVLGVSWHRRNTMYWAVRAGGWVPWNKRAKKIRSL